MLTQSRSLALTSRLTGVQAVAFWIALAVSAAFALANAVVVINGWWFDDVHAYVAAAQRILDGHALYTSGLPETLEYRYAPWFAVAWVPFARLPALGIEIAWAGCLLAATVFALWRYRTSPAGWCLILLLGSLLFRTDGFGNVQALVVGALVWLLPTRAGPWVTGVAASVKPFALGLIPVYVWRREWRSALIAISVAMVLWAPTLLFGTAGYPPLRALNVYDASLLLALPAMFASD